MALADASQPTVNEVAERQVGEAALGFTRAADS